MSFGENRAANVQFVVDSRSRITKLIRPVVRLMEVAFSVLVSVQVGCIVFEILTCSARLCLKIISTDEVWRAEGRDVSGGGERNRRLGDTTYSARWMMGNQ